MRSAEARPPRLINQREDFLLRESDPYAASKYAILLSRLGRLEGKKALVVGCGSGEFAAFLAARGAEVKGLDIDPVAIDLTHRFSSKLGVRVQAEVANIESYQDPVRYDLVVATDVIEHIRDDRAAMGRIHSLCAPGGRFVITVPALSFLFGYHDEVLGHFRRYSKSELRRVLAPHMSIELLRYYGFFLIPVALLISRILRRPYPVGEVSASGTGASLGGRVISGVVRALLRVESWISPPLGTSLIAVGKNRPGTIPTQEGSRPTT